MSARVLPAAAIGAAVALWSVTYVLSGWALETGSAAVLSVGRFGLALVVLLPFAARRPGFAAAMRSPRTIVLGLLGVTLYYALANIGLLFTTAGTAALVASFMPAMTAIVALIVLRERISGRTGIGLGLATIGVALISTAGVQVDVGAILNLLAVVAYALYTVLLRREDGSALGRDALSLATATIAWGTILMLPWLGGEILTGTAAIPSDPRGILSILAEGVVITAPALVLFSYAAQRLPAAVSGVAFAAVPALGYGFALLVGEPFDPLKAIGGGVALVGVLIATLSQTEEDLPRRRFRATPFDARVGGSQRAIPVEETNP
ncbi:DMT family transporter [Microbacterium sp. X-17]|uniref:DMT family transporter n=1 Tax=Microbacterium sp. X-17 TaxID=3144404 RepID=UPI0031F47E0F